MATSEVRQEIDSDAVKREWLDRLDTIVEEVEGWAKASGWRTRRIDKTLTERRLGSYKVPVLLMEKNTVEVGASGAVDLYVAPAYDDIASLYLEGDHWVLHYADQPDPTATGSVLEAKPQPYSETTIRKILDGMAADG
jgi:hypothetical protein